MRATWFTLAFVAISAVPIVAGPILWIDDISGNLATVDVGTGQVTQIGNFGGGLVMDDIAFDASGTLWGIDNSHGLYNISTTNGLATLVHVDSSHADFLNSLVFGTDGTLYAANNQLFKVNTTTNGTCAGPIGTLCPVGGAFGNNLASAGDLAFLNGNLYLSTLDLPYSGTTGTLITVNTTTGASTVDGALGALGTNKMFGLAASGGVLYGVANTSIYTINPTTGVKTFVLDYLNAAGNQLPIQNGIGGGPFLTQAFGTTFKTEAQTPEPATFVLLGGGLLALGVFRKRAQRR